MRHLYFTSASYCDHFVHVVDHFVTESKRFQWQNEYRHADQLKHHIPFGDLLIQRLRYKNNNITPYSEVDWKGVVWMYTGFLQFARIFWNHLPPGYIIKLHLAQYMQMTPSQALDKSSTPFLIHYQPYWSGNNMTTNSGLKYVALAILHYFTLLYLQEFQWQKIYKTCDFAQVLCLFHWRLMTLLSTKIVVIIVLRYDLSLSHHTCMYRKLKFE